MVVTIEFKDIVMSRYACKKFTGEKIPEHKVNELLEIIRYSPSSYNMQPWKIKIIRDKKLKQKLLLSSLGQIQVTTCSHLLVFCVDTDLEKLINKLSNLMKESKSPLIKRTGWIALLKKFVKSMDKEQRINWAQKQIYIALANALNGAKSLGFVSCPMEGFNKKKYADILELPGNLIPTVLCPIGYAADKQEKKMRFSKEDILI